MEITNLQAQSLKHRSVCRTNHIPLEVSLWSCSWMFVKCDELSVVRGMWGERVRWEGREAEGRWNCWVLLVVGWRSRWPLPHSGVPGDPLSCSSALVPLIPHGWRWRREGGEMLTLFGCQVSLPPQKSPAIHLCTCTHTHPHRKSESECGEDYNLCCGIWEAPLQLSPSVQTAPPAPQHFTSLFLTPSLLSSPVWASRWMKRLPFLSDLSALLTIELCELFAVTTIGCALIFFVWPATHPSLPITYSAFPHPCFLAQRVV